MPLRDRKGWLFGHTTKDMSSREFSEGKTKAKHYIKNVRPMLHYADASYMNTINKYKEITSERSVKAVLVEDVISATKIAHLPIFLSRSSRKYAGIALLGTDLNTEKVKDILAAGYNKVIIALDPDATSKAFKLQKEYGLFFSSLEVRVLPEDPKDMPYAKLETLLNEEED
jgi:hypothetical protein